MPLKLIKMALIIGSIIKELMPAPMKIIAHGKKEKENAQRQVKQFIADNRTGKKKEMQPEKKKYQEFIFLESFHNAPGYALRMQISHRKEVIKMKFEQQRQMVKERSLIMNIEHYPFRCQLR